MPKKRDISGEIEEVRNYTNHQTGTTHERGNHQLSPLKPSKCGRVNIGSKKLNVFNGVPQQKPVWIQSANDHNKRDYEFKRLCSGRI